MRNTSILTVKQATAILLKGQIIAYPTESTYGLGCNALNEKAVHKLYQLKRRKHNHPFIMLIHQKQQAYQLIDSQYHSLLKIASNYWPGPVTCLFPASNDCPKWLIYNRRIALRISNHPCANALTANIPFPLISTSANIHGEKTLQQSSDILDTFPSIGGVVEGQPGNTNPTKIIDLLTGDIHRD
ncbi:MAG: L-threonylcarbamoyladenylate synthase [Pseudomonadota bacterium]|nr:L-threonylcarbamoyladenylate synthase [Pseudomonadota bacterium]